MDRLAPDTPIFGLQAQGIDGALPFHETIEEMAIAYLEAIQQIDPNGPYRLVGYSGGGVIAFEMAQRLKAQAKAVTLLAMLDTLAPQHMETPITRLDKLRLLPRADPQFLLHWPERTWRKRQAEQRVMHVKGDEIPDDVSPIEVLGNRAWHAFWNAQLKYRAQPYDGDIVLFRAKRASFRYISAGEALGWDELVTGRVEVIAINAWHDTVFDAPSVDVVAAELAQRL
jgi:thioesterase domain-containing protein